ncbi:related to RNA polymerase II transcription factor [Cephalotrichum gorgonifer]|uniref:Related to RNA polymerase II transcription factor n=1 Tax=Cephalotrichum gorgonifer TaxID=2041049 RepID=A0AAE8N6B5_9PEZI|nr:related to RNA polymerase II transcription factor [Cephalotrichum gorgonifer]
MSSHEESPSGRAAFKKKDGVISLSPDQRTVLWTPAPGNGPPTITLPVENITNLQKTPDSSPKVMLKIFEKRPDGGDPVTYLFHFNTPAAKAEADAMRDVLSRVIGAVQGNNPDIPKPIQPVSNGPATTPSAPGASGSMTFAATVSSQPSSARWFDDAQLRNDIALQLEYLKTDANLNQTYMEARATKPDSISLGAFNSQFWSTRTHILRAFLIDKNQQKADYNVLSTIKPKTVDGDLKLNITEKQIALIFKQHPLIMRIYNEHVPKITESEFWSRFFLSKLAKKLRGERVASSDAHDTIFDRYDPNDDLNNTGALKIAPHGIPYMIDIEANEENQGGLRSGNRKDSEMRPRKDVPILKSLNSLSAKLMENVAPADVDPHAPKGMDEATYNSLVLRDLRVADEVDRIHLQINEEQAFSSKGGEVASSNADVFAKQDPESVLRLFRSDIGHLITTDPNGIDLQGGTGIEEDSDSENDDEPATKRPHVGSRAARAAAQSDILAGIRRHRSEKYGGDWTDDAPMGLPPSVAQQCALTNTTSVEFLRQFWMAFLSGDPDRAAELQYLVEALQRSVDRIHAVADDAEKRREEIIALKKKQIREHFERTQKRIRWKAESVGGGKSAVLTLMQATLESLAKAREEYRKALEAEGLRASTEA